MATITVGLMDPPHESANTVTGFRIVDAALRKGHDVNVFLYEGAVGLGFADQKPHANPVKNKSVEELDHPNPKDWVNCGLCVDERGVEKQVEGARRGSPADFWKLAEASQGFLYVATR